MQKGLLFITRCLQSGTVWQLSVRGRWWKRAFGRYLFRDANIWLSFGCPAPATRNYSHKWNMSHGSYKPVDRVIFDMDGLLLGPETHFYLLLVMLCFKCWNPFIHSSRVRVWWRPGPPQPVEKHYWHDVSCKVFICDVEFGTNLNHRSVLSTCLP